MTLINSKTARKARCHSQARIEDSFPVRNAKDEQAGPSVPLGQERSPAISSEREQLIELSVERSPEKRGERRCRSPRQNRRARSTSSRGSRPQTEGSIGTPTLVQRLESIDRGMRPLELAMLLGVGKSTLYDWVDAGTIPAYRHRGVIFFDPALIAAWLRRQATQGPPE